MKRALILQALLAILLFSAAGCSSSDDSGDTNPLVGFWHISTREGITSIRIDESGTGEATIYTYNGDIWEKNTRLLQYTLANDYLTIKIDGEDAICGRIAITGTSLSITQGNDISMFTGYNGDDAKIKELQTRIEGNYSRDENGGSNDNDNDDDITIQPPFIDVVEGLWLNENDVAAILATIYMELIEFEAEQLNLENIIITGKDLYGSAKIIETTSQEIEECWSAAYKAINRCNTVIEHAPEECIGYINEAKALRCFVYYNVAHLWGKAPYITDSDAYANSPVLNKEEIFDILLSEIEEIGSFREIDDRYKNYYINYETLQTIKGEIKMSQGNHAAALSLFASNVPEFSLSLESNTQDYQNTFGNTIPLYTAQLTSLLEKEARGETEEALLLWQEQKVIGYGYWAMLKRTVKAQDVTGCKEHEILMPIPESEMRYNTNMTQNPGY